MSGQVGLEGRPPCDRQHSAQAAGAAVARQKLHRLSYGRRSVRAVPTFDAELWLHDGEAAWCFVMLPADVSDDIADRTDGSRRGFGSVRVRVTVGGTSWETSVFPDSKRGAYRLPVKKEGRRREALKTGDLLSVDLEVL